MHNMNGKQQGLSDADLALVWWIQTIKASVIFSLFSCSCAESMSTLHPSTHVLWLFTVQGRSDFIHICFHQCWDYEREFFASPKCAVLPLASLHTKPKRPLPELFSPHHLWASNEEAHMESTAHCLPWNLISWLLLVDPCCQPMPSPGWLSSPTIIPPLPAPKLGKPAMSWRETSTHAVPPEWRFSASLLS